MDNRAKSELHEAVTRLIWNRSFREDYRGSWDEARELKHITGAYRSTTAAYLTASDILDLVEAHAAKSAGQAAGERRLMTLLEGKREDLFEPGRGDLKYRLGDDGLVYIHLTNREAREILSAKPAPNSTRTGAKCAARRQGTAGGNDPADCDWPMCGCDPHADKVIAALQECGHLLAPAPDSTRTGAAETEETVAKALYRHDYGSYPDQPEWDAAPASVQKRYRALSEAALAARPEAPSDAGWSREDLEAFVAREWPEGRSAGAAARELVRALGVRGLAPTLQRLLTDLLGQINFASTDRAQILADFANAAPEAARMAKIDSFERWNPRVFDPTPPSDPAPSGQADG